MPCPRLPWACCDDPSVSIMPTASVGLTPIFLMLIHCLITKKEIIMLGCCGLECSKCDAFIATANRDDVLRAKVAVEWTKAFNTQIKPEYVNCTGCHSTGVKIHYCECLCEVRKCVNNRRMDTCAHCNDFPCAHLTPIFKMAPQAESTLQSLRK